ncbi:MAG TPA: thiamine pyrophosphate-dependent enzyme, partial [Candidatus Acidoferrum sp.]|nr:thiamine pyrophosphate-dependent enzyme [Candidatus Acidoferrum sp.]
VRKAFKLAEMEKPGATHIELPQDVMAQPLDARPLPRQMALPSQPTAGELLKAVSIIQNAENPIILAGNGVIRGVGARALREFVHATGIPAAETFMAKGLLPADASNALGAVGLNARDYEVAGFEAADVVIAVGYDLVEHSPKYWNRRRDKTIICIDTEPAETDQYFMPDVELVGDLYSILCELTERCVGPIRTKVAPALSDAVLRRFKQAEFDEGFPMQPPRALFEIRKALGARDILVSDVGLHKMWIARMFPAYEPNTVLVANGLAGMGFAVPGAIAAKLVHPERKVVAVSGDGGFLMNCQELETAVRLGTPFVNVIWENQQFGSIVWKQEKKFGRHFGTDFGNPDFVKLAESFGMPAWRCTSAEDYAERLRAALTLDVPSLIVVPVDYSLDVTIVEDLGPAMVAG